MRNVFEALQGLFASRFNPAPALPMGDVSRHELNLHQEDLDREFAEYQQRPDQSGQGDSFGSLMKVILSSEPTFTLDLTTGKSEKNMGPVVEGTDQDFTGEVESIELVTPLALAEDPNWKTHELATGKVVNDWVGEQTGPGVAFSKLIHNEFFALAWNWHRESSQNGKLNYARHHRFFFMIGELILAENWVEVEKLTKLGFTVGQETELDRAVVVVNNVPVSIDLAIIRLDLKKRNNPWHGVMNTR